jgi:UDP-N-acetylmuramoyl-tripeptide--D-alanyl-D-alanine ligase
VAEMGTYGTGEIAELCRWCPPSIAVITAIGPVHLERFKSEDAIVAAKSEITERAHTVVLNVDDPHRLAALADRLAAAGTKSVVRCSAVDHGGRRLCRGGRGCGDGPCASGASLGSDINLPGSVQPTNLACALAVVLALGSAAGGGALPHRHTPHGAQSPGGPARRPSGVWVIDDTFNSNPSRSRVALAN